MFKLKTTHRLWVPISEILIQNLREELKTLILNKCFPNLKKKKRVLDSEEQSAKNWWHGLQEAILRDRKLLKKQTLEILHSVVCSNSCLCIRKGDHPGPEKGWGKEEATAFIMTQKAFGALDFLGR